MRFVQSVVIPQSGCTEQILSNKGCSPDYFSFAEFGEIKLLLRIPPFKEARKKVLLNHDTKVIRFINDSASFIAGWQYLKNRTFLRKLSEIRFMSKISRHITKSWHCVHSIWESLSINRQWDLLHFSATRLWNGGRTARCNFSYLVQLVQYSVALYQS